ncbi:RWD domain-containing protein 4 [Agrilus planipennis]|uniref:RWD domain-containing protein 4 n=1 Tax=Agrilus planipennis TaxID=224129 RepID=A0A1W4WKK0_AGRPL|nr:RWD domain-containing protein 4 [Agrilus planipennis]
MTDLELQEEEREALLSIYDGDSSFNQLSPTTFQYKFGVSDDPKSFLLEIKWGEHYPSEPPQINMDTFYNKHITNSLKNKIIKLVSDESQEFLGMSMTYSLFELVKERFDDLIKEQPDEEPTTVEDNIHKLSLSEPLEEQKKKQPKKEQLTKAQKRRQWDRVTDRGEKPRGWDWVDIVKHLSQTGAKEGNVSGTS